MKATLNTLPGSSDFVKEAHVTDTRIDWVLDVDGRTVLSSQSALARSLEPLILLELAGVHARYHARVEPTFLLLDDLLDDYVPRAQIAALERLQKVAEHAQVAVISHSPFIPAETSRHWTVTALDDRQRPRSPPLLPPRPPRQPGPNCPGPFFADTCGCRRVGGESLRRGRPSPTQRLRPRGWDRG